MVYSHVNLQRYRPNSNSEWLELAMTDEVYDGATVDQNALRVGYHYLVSKPDSFGIDHIVSKNLP